MDRDSDIIDKGMARWPNIGACVDAEECVKFLAEWAQNNPPSASSMSDCRKAFQAWILERIKKVPLDELADGMSEYFSGLVFKALIKQLSEMKEGDSFAN